VVDQDQAFGMGSQKGLHLFKYPRFSVTIIGYHTKVVILYRPRKRLI